MAFRSSSFIRSNKLRWGMLPNAVGGNTKEGLEEVQIQSVNSLAWEDIDHSLTLDLGETGSTSIVFRKNFDGNDHTVAYMALRSCAYHDFTPEMKDLVEMAQVEKETSFLLTHCVFHYNESVFVGSELSDISLADLIDCTIPMNEMHLSTILDQVARALHELHSNSERNGSPLIYGSLRASNVFIERDGTVKLATFGTKVRPKKSTEENSYRDRWDLGALASHIISGSPDEPDNLVLQHKMISMSCIGRSVDVSSQPSPELIDIWGLCYLKQSGVEDILKHPFLKLGKRRSLTRLVMNAERKASRECVPKAV